MSVTAELLKEFEKKIDAWTLLPSGGGRFEVKVGDDLVYSKLATGSFPTGDQVRELVTAKL